MSTLNLDELLKSDSSHHPSTRAPSMPPEVAAERKREQNRRAQRATALAMRALANAYPTEYHHLREQAMAKLSESWGPLPGDDLIL
jgi:hypothetical protein